MHADAEPLGGLPSAAPVRILVAVLRGVRIGPDGSLLLPVGAPAAWRGPDGSAAWALAATRKALLAGSPALRHRFLDVFRAFGALSFVQRGPGGSARARLTPRLLQRAAAALELELEALPERTRGSASLLQVNLKTQRQGTSAEAAEAARVGAEVQRGLQAEKEARSQDGLSGRALSESIVRMERRLRAKVDSGMKAEATLVSAIRSSRQSQLNTLSILLDVLKGRYTVDYRAFSGDASFIQVAAAMRTLQAQMSGVQVEIESALKNKQDTHGILLRLQAVLNGTSGAVDIIQSTTGTLGSAWRTIESEQPSADEAKRLCASQTAHASETARRLKAGLALIDSVREHTESSIGTVGANLRAIREKMRLMESSAKDFQSAVEQALAVLEGQSKSRHIVVAAIRKAGTMAGPAINDPSVPSLFAQLVEDMEAQEVQERSYRGGQAALHSAFETFLHAYMQAMSERADHYERSLAALQLYASEVTSDAEAQQEAWETSQELAREGGDLCGHVLRRFEHREQRRRVLGAALHATPPPTAPDDADDAGAGDQWGLDAESDVAAEV